MGQHVLDVLDVLVLVVQDVQRHVVLDVLEDVCLLAHLHVQQHVLIHAKEKYLVFIKTK